MKIGSTHVLIAIVLIILITGAWVWLFVEPPEKCTCSAPDYFEGTLFVNEAGSPKGDSNYTAEYSAQLYITDSHGFIAFAQISGDSDKLTQHVFNVSCACIDDGSLSFGFEDYEITLDWVGVDTIWDGNYSNYYIASRGSLAEPNEVRGSIFAFQFPGLPDPYYVELRLRPG
ncbi:MAG: hypothetical protein ACE5QF_08230 [Thermoplasmata archaeon]